MENGEKTEKSQSKEEIKSLLRRYINEWHPDRVGAIETQDLSIMHVLTLLNTALNEERVENLSSWPEPFQTGNKVSFPSFDTNETGRTIYLPQTPQEFLDLLEYIKKNRVFPLNDFSEVVIKKGERKRESEREDDPTLQSFRRFVNERNSIEDLVAVFDLLDLYSEEQLLSINFPALFDQRASFLFTRMVYETQSRTQLQEVEKKITDFKFYTDNGRKTVSAALKARLQELPDAEKAPLGKPDKTFAELSDTEQLSRKATEKEARLDFIQKVRETDTIDELEKLNNSVNSFTFFNRGELGIVRSALNRKINKLRQNSTT